MRTLAIDFGRRRIGLALSDAGGKLATPLKVLEVRTEDGALAEILKVIKEEGVARVVVGLPLNMDSSRGAGAKQALAFGARLASGAGMEVVFVDERLSTFAAEQRLIEEKRQGQKLTRKGKKGRLDAIAAAGFLQEFLDGKLKAME
jgi:putative Holliday junction resolvase